MRSASTTDGSAAGIGVALGAGALGAFALGVYASVHDPTGRGLVLVPAGSVDEVKTALAAISVGLFCGQLAISWRLRRSRLGPKAAANLGDLHRIVGTLAFGLSLPVVFHCVWALGFDVDDPWTATHSVVGCVAYGVYLSQFVFERRTRGSGAATIAAGAGLMFGTLVTVAMATALVTGVLGAQAT